MAGRLICIAGGIGSGKSVVSKIIKGFGYPIYDCDSRARHLMDQSAIIKSRIYNEISSEAVDLKNNGLWGDIRRGVLANIVFNSKKHLDKLNQITHAEVREDIIRWGNSHNDAVAFIETAIPFSSGIYKISDIIWYVRAPLEVRINRTMSRDHTSRNNIFARIKSQTYDSDHLKSCSEIPVFTIDNDGERAILPQVIDLITKLIIQN